MRSSSFSALCRPITLIWATSFACNSGTGLATKHCPCDSATGSPDVGNASVAWTGGAATGGSSTGGGGTSDADGPTTNRDVSPQGTGGIGESAADGRDAKFLDTDSQLGGASGSDSGISTGQDSGRGAGSGPWEIKGFLPRLSADSGVRLLAMGDLNGDGKPDIVTTRQSNGNILVLLGDGKGRFASSADLSISERPYALALVDVNGDGSLDIVTGEGTLIVLLGKGDGTFFPEVDSPLAGTAIFRGLLAAGDLDGDGKLDLAFASRGLSTSSVVVDIGNGDGRFDTKSISDIGTGSPGAIAIGDFNGDHRPDVVTLVGDDTLPWTAKVLVLFGAENGTIGAKQQLTCGDGPDSLAVGDFNRDGKLDIATTSTSSGDGVICVLMGNGDGTFRGPVASPVTADPGPISLLPVDMNGDGYLDLVAEAYVYLGNGDGTFVKGSAIPGSSFAYYQAVADINGDGRPDIANAFEDIAVALQQPDGTFGPAPKEYPTDQGAASIVVGDLNRDGQLDIVTANTASVSVLLGKGGGKLAAKVDYPVGGRPATLLLGDVNADGTLDIVTDVPAGVLLGKGDGTFTATVDNSTGIDGTSIALGDLNGDGKPDAVTVTFPGLASGETTASIRLGKGDGTFAGVTEYKTGVAPASVALGDINGDGRLDMVVANSGGDAEWSIAVFVGNGDGTFGVAKQIESGSGPDWIALVDLNNDGKLDILTRNYYELPTVYLGEGDGNFKPGVHYSLYLAESVALGDVDGDGNLDVASTGNSSGQVLSVGFGKGDGTLGSEISYNLDLTGIALGDFDGDGVMDIVATKAGANAVVLLFGTRP